MAVSGSVSVTVSVSVSVPVTATVSVTGSGTEPGSGTGSGPGPRSGSGSATGSGVRVRGRDSARVREPVRVRVRACAPALPSPPLDHPPQHGAHLVEERQCLPRTYRIHGTGCEEQPEVDVQLPRRAVRHTPVVAPVLPGAALALGDVGGNRRCGPDHLVGQGSERRLHRSGQCERDPGGLDPWSAWGRVSSRSFMTSRKPPGRPESGVVQRPAAGRRALDAGWLRGLHPHHRTNGRKPATRGNESSHDRGRVRGRGRDSVRVGVRACDRACDRVRVMVGDGSGIGAGGRRPRTAAAAVSVSVSVSGSGSGSMTPTCHPDRASGASEWRDLPRPWTVSRTGKCRLRSEDPSTPRGRASLRSGWQGRAAHRP